MDESYAEAWRGWIWRNGISVIIENPLLGTGPDTFFFTLGGRQIPRDELNSEALLPEIIDLYGLQLEYFELTGSMADKAHNTFLQIAVCMGLPALLAFLIYLGGLIGMSVKNAFDRPLLLAFSTAAICFLIQSFFQIDTPIDRSLLYVVLGVMSGEIGREKCKIS